MLALELITDQIVPLKISDSGIIGLSLMEEYKTNHFPVVNSNLFFGLISESDIYSYNHFEEAVGAHPIHKSNISVRDDQHIYDVMTIMHENELSLLPEA